MTPRVSVVVPTYRRPAYLDRCLAALMDQDCEPSEYDVLVVDDAAAHETCAQVHGWAERARRCGRTVHYVPNRHTRGPAAARNVGWRAATGSIIAFTDDDCMPDPAWLRLGLAAFQDDVAGVTGRIIVPLPPIPTDYERSTAKLEEAQFATANCFYHRDVLEQTGGFDECFSMAWREDTDLFFTALERGFRLVGTQDAVVIHAARPSPWGVSVRQQRKSAFNALLYKKHPTLYRAHIQSYPPWQYYAIVLSVLISASTRRRSTRHWAGLIWMALTGGFCVHRIRGTSHRPGHIAEMIATSIVIPPLAVYWRLRGALTFRVVFL